MFGLKLNPVSKRDHRSSLISWGQIVRCYCLAQTMQGMKNYLIVCRGHLDAVSKIRDTRSYFIYLNIDDKRYKTWTWSGLTFDNNIEIVWKLFIKVLKHANNKICSGSTLSIEEHIRGLSEVDCSMSEPTLSCRGARMVWPQQWLTDCNCNGVFQVIKRLYLKEKLVFVISIVTIVLLSYALLSLHWLLPYYYAVSAPLLIIIRIILYW